MAIRGSCLCGGFRFELDKVVGPFEICHCNRCRKQSGSNGLAMVGVNSEDYRLLSGAANIATYEAPILNDPPPYHAYFCTICGSSVPPTKPTGWFEIPAGLLDDDPEIRPDRHIFVELAAPWDELDDGLPRFTVRELAKARQGVELPEDFAINTHHGSKHPI